jgi:IS1 family transposase
VKALCDGCSIRDVARISDVAINTVVKLLVELGSVCLDYQDRVIHDLPCTRLQCDDVWSFVYAKAKNVPEEPRGEKGYGDVWTWTAIDDKTKLVPCWHVGNRTGDDAAFFVADLAARLANRVQITDGLKVYVEAVEGAFGADVDYAQLIKIYGPDPNAEAEHRYSPPVCTGTEVNIVQGNPDPAHISTSYVERHNLTMRMSMRRFTRLTNAFSKKLENHMWAIALFFMHYNFCRPHKTLSKHYPKTPAMAAGLTDHVWTIEKMLDLLADSN